MTKDYYCLECPWETDNYRDCVDHNHCPKCGGIVEDNTDPNKAPENQVRGGNYGG